MDRAASDKFDTDGRLEFSADLCGGVRSGGVEALHLPIIP